jgi:hypothetical protein
VQHGKQDRLSSDKLMVRPVHVVARYTKIHIKYSILISGKLQYPANLWSRRCQISKILLYLGGASASLGQVSG